MEDLSNFIHEEIFLIDKLLPQTSKPEKKQYKLAVITGQISNDDQALLDKILSALNLSPSEILHTSEFDANRSDTWIVFDKSLSIENSKIDFYEPTLIQNSTIILAQPLSIMSESVQDKQKLWNVLKGIFSI